MKDTIFKIINKFTEGVDTYYNNRSMWLIFTDEKKWVIELTKEGTLWYNYYFFQDCFKYVSLDAVENQHYITEWVKSIIQNGVKETIHCSVSNDENSREALQNGIKITDNKILSEQQVKRVIRKSRALGQSEVTEKEINKVIKETHDDAYHNSGRVRGVINNGIKEVKELPDKSGELNGYGEYYARQKNRTYPHTDIVNDVINGGIKETKYCELHSLMMADHIIRDGIKETNWRKVDNHPTYLDRIIDEGSYSSK